MNETLKLFGLDQPKHILIVEDHVSFAVELAAMLGRLDHSVSVYAGVEGIDGASLTGINPLTSQTPATVSLEQTQFCFLDHYFEGMMNGTTLTPTLVQYQVVVCGMSSVESANQSMQRRGAVFAFQKDALARLLLRR
jgi:CheY-like chemotaxis protein